MSSSTINGQQVLIAGSVLLRGGDVFQATDEATLEIRIQDSPTAPSPIRLSGAPHGVIAEVAGVGPGDEYAHSFGFSLANGQSCRGDIIVNRIAEVGSHGLYHVTYSIAVA